MTARLVRRSERLSRRATAHRRAEAAAIGTEAAGSQPCAGLAAFPAGAGLTGGLASGLAGQSGVVLKRTLLALARETYNIRRRRARFLPADLFGEPTWDILLDLYVAARENRPVPTTSACIGAHVPPTTALRWLRILEARGLVEREEDGKDGRRTFVRLSTRGIAAMEGYLHAALTTLDAAVGLAWREDACGVQVISELVAEAAE
jgi:DNA-binding transcriptional ArsR family regulator